MSLFIARHGLTLEAVPVPENPDMTDSEWSRTAKARHYHCTIRTAAKPDSVTCYWSCGVGVIEHWAGKDKGGPARVWRNQVRGYNPRTAHYQEALEAIAKHYRPDLESILESLQSDFRTVADGQTFSEWCGDLGYSDDSISALRTYDLIRDRSAEFRDLIGREAFREFLESDFDSA